MVSGGVGGVRGHSVANFTDFCTACPQIDGDGREVGLREQLRPQVRVALGHHDRVVAEDRGQLLDRVAREDPLRREGAFLVVGMAEGATPSEAGHAAVIAARRSAVLCVFGASISAELDSLETNDSSSGTERIRQSIAVESVDWQGFELVAGHSLTLQDEHGFRVHAQYRWSREQAEAARSRARELAAAAERARALKVQVATQGRMIEAQRERLAELDHQQQELAALKDRADAAAVRIASWSAEQSSKNASVAKAVAKLFCGITFQQVIDSLGEPDELKTESPFGSCIFGASMRWAEFVLKPSDTYCARSDQDASQWLPLALCH